MAIVVIGNTKGGGGKTSLAVQVALMRAAAGHSVLPIDADRQGSAQTAATMRRSDLPVVPMQPGAVDVWSFTDAAELVDQVEEAR